MSNSIATPFPFFAGLDGDALEAGKIYIGDEGLDAATNPKAAYFDRDMTVSAAQPVRTISGYAANGSSAAQIFTDGAYSISVYTSSDVLVFSSLSQAGDITVIESNVDANTVAISSLGSASSENFTDDDDLDIDPENVGTRGNAKAYVDEVISSGAVVTSGSFVSEITTTGITADVDFSTLYYSRIGDVVFVNGYIRIDTVSSPTGFLNITLPFVPVDNGFSGTTDIGFGVVYTDASETGVTTTVLGAAILSSLAVLRIGEGEKGVATYESGDFFKLSFHYVVEEDTDEDDE